MQHVSTIYARFICRELPLDEAQTDWMLGASSLSCRDIRTQATMPYPDFFSFLERVIASEPSVDLGLRVGARLIPPSLGELGSALLCAPTLQHACRLAETFIPVHVGYIRLQADRHADGLTLNFVELADLKNTRRFQIEVLLLLVQNLIEAVTGQPFDHGEFRFPYPLPDNHSVYPEYFHSPARFSSRFAAVDIPHHYLTLPSPFYDPIAWDNFQLTLKARKHQLQIHDHKPYCRQVLQVLNERGDVLPCVGETARRLNMTERSLSRHLKGEGSSYRALRNRLVLERAQFYLRHTDLSVDAIAGQLGYQDYSSFRRVFKKWIGCTPTTYRNGGGNR
ncbi:AraC family transcriptional regulator [Marinobacter zhejiangensis]|uniref:AraC family transcriptional regulator n=1 Tax=Marinobacter zhejiangensis TaxID=488535 RepID=UPI001587540C|nr:AraC family transcriptional regulator [Marinobacter zhejiangensis]